MILIHNFLFNMTNNTHLIQFLERDNGDYLKCEAFLSSGHGLIVWFKDSKQIPNSLKGRTVENR